MKRKGSFNSNNGKKDFAGAAIGILVAFLLLFPTWKASEVENTVEFGGNGLERSVVHPIINLVGNAALAGFANNTGGNGTSWDDAVIIESLEITAGANQHCIVLSNTDLYTVIRDCTLTGATSGYRAGICLYNCTNVNITGNVAFDNCYGIYLISSSHGNTILSNDLTGNILTAIILESSCHHNSIVGNLMSNNYNGIELVSLCHDNTFSGNVMADNAQCGIDMSDSCHDNTFSGNIMADNAQCGIFMFDSCNGNIISGNMLSIQDTGISLWSSCNNNSIFGNYVMASSYSIEFQTSSQNNVVSMNHIASETRDDVPGNTWACNCWRDYVDKYPSATNNGVYWNTSYAVEGTAGSVDPFPLVSPITTSDENPTATFMANATTILAGDRIQFGFIGDRGNGIVFYEWDFGDGSPNATTPSPEHQYTAAGTYTVTLTVTDIDRDTSSFSMEIEVAAGGGMDVSTIAIIAVGAGAGVLALGNVFQFMKARKVKGRSPGAVAKEG